MEVWNDNLKGDTIRIYVGNELLLCFSMFMEFNIELRMNF